MVAAIFRQQKRRNPGSGRSIRFGLLIAVILTINLGWKTTEDLKLGFVGDILPDRGVKSVIQKKGLSGLFQNTPMIFQDVDLVCANLEAAITMEKTPLQKTFRFNSPLNLGEHLAKNKIKIVSVANNHSIDYGKTGLKDTVTNLRKYQVRPLVTVTTPKMLWNP
jgi:hypothetical protein